ncbi:hypothetical protein [Aureimonas phyllosphaerae]|uniref:Uncharacterized protein n=1 Tax=Aureimonas phyllosphaerae TaxID=1166078 RepID=A0A7W6FXG6_9HYPH|nr:hypothetical protein [Aureimonas phyllosphaerae]MBB3938102.1 hypothetical protein [Aureimonas phyllosphaerae]MBB3962109.1 hypothetical protein [Aureimonas phyllosphaerae]SFF55930.1 hypothetical protein SAMN05216566_12818 [Aureimonas phyllosphaerae]
MRYDQEWDEYDRSLDKRRETLKADLAVRDHHRTIDDRRRDEARQTENRRLLAEGAKANVQQEAPAPRPKIDPRAAAAERRRRFLRALRARRGRVQIFMKNPKLRDMLLVMGTGIMIAVKALLAMFKKGMQNAAAYVPVLEFASAPVQRREVELIYPPPTHSPKPKPKKTPQAARPEAPAPAPAPVRAAMPTGTTKRLTPEQIEKEKQDKWLYREAMEDAEFRYGDKRILAAVAECLGGRTPATFHFEVMRKVDPQGDLLDFFRGRHDLAELRATIEAFKEKTSVPGVDERYIAQQMLPTILANAQQYGALVRLNDAADASQDATMEPDAEKPEQPSPAQDRKHDLDPWTRKPS